MKTNLVLLLLITQILSRHTRMLIGINRHGARYSYSHLEPEDQHGMLTQNGLRMAYFLGKYLKITYKDFFALKFKSDDNYIEASGIARCRQTAQAILLGIYDFGSLNEELKVKKEYRDPEWSGLDIPADFKSALPKGFYPVPVHSFLEEENIVFQTDQFRHCPNVWKMHEKDVPEEVSYILAAVNKFLPKMRNEVFDYRKLINKEKMETLGDFALPDFYISQRFRGFDLGLDESSFEELERLDTVIMKYKFFRFKELNKYLFTEIGRKVLAKLEELRDGINEGKDVHKFVLFSGHDTNVYSILLAAELANDDCIIKPDSCQVNPRFAAMFLYEVYEDEGHVYVETTYNGKKVKFCGVDKEGDCQLDEFIEFLKTKMYMGEIETIRNKYCKESVRELSDLMYWMVGFNVMVIFTVRFLIFRKKKLTENE